MYLDAHSHLNLSQFDADREETCARMRAAGVSTITVGVDLPSSKDALQFAESHDEVWATIGLHPTDSKTEIFDPAVYGTLAKSEKVVAVGECGLDYFRGADAAEKKRQQDCFEAQIAFAIEYDLPLMLHGRPSKGTMDAYEDMVSVLTAHTHPKLRGNAHFFIGTKKIAQQLLDLNFTISYPGMITFAREYDEVIQYVPADRILSETDAPFAAPLPYRGKRNEPAYVVEVVAALARIRGVPEPEMATQTRQNGERLFFS